MEAVVSTSAPGLAIPTRIRRGGSGFCSRSIAESLPAGYNIAWKNAESISLIFCATVGATPLFYGLAYIIPCEKN